MSHQYGLIGWIHGHHNKTRQSAEINPNWIEGIVTTISMCKKCGLKTIKSKGVDYISSMGTTWTNQPLTEIGYRDVNKIVEELESQE